MGKVAATATSGASAVKTVMIAIGAAALGVTGAVYGPSLLQEFRPGESGGNEVVDGSVPKAGFTLGSISSSEPVSSIVVTLKAGADGADLNERVDVHLGTGFPLRLFPLGNDARTPAFAAFPQKSSLEPGETSIHAGGEATFEFSTQSENGQDLLGTTPQLLKDLTVGDLTAIGFSSLGASDWVLEGYRIEVNGKLFAEHDSVNARPGTVLGEVRKELASLKPESEVLLKEIADLKTLMATGLGSDKDKADLALKEAAMEEIAGPLNLLAGQGAGYYPWYVEQNKKLLSKIAVDSPVSEIGIKLLAGGGEEPGTRNPLYIKAGAKKFLLTSEADPLIAREAPQEFTLSLADLKYNPITTDDLDKIGVGVIGNEERFGQVPDRAKLQRVVITADGKTIYDSELKVEDRRALEAYWLVPPAHYDHAGQIIQNQEKATEKYLWLSGMVAPPEIISNKVPVAPETPLPGGTPGSFQPISFPALPGGAGLPGSTTPGTPGLAPSAPGLTPGSGFTPLPAPGSNPGLSPLPGGITPGINPGQNPGQNPGFPGSGIGQSQPAVTTFSGSPSGTFIPTGQFDPATGLVRGTLQRTNIGGFTPIRSDPGIGGLNPAIFNQPTIPSNNQRGLTASDIAQLATAILNIIKPTPATPTPANPIAPPTIDTAGFPNTMSAVEIGRKATVDWTVLGDASGMGTISSFRIDLMPVLPHLSPPTPAGSKALATTSADANSRTVSVPAIILPAGGFPGVKKEDLPLLLVKPVVTALDANGKTVGTAREGALLPLLPDPTTYNLHGVQFSLLRGITTKPIDDPASELGGSFQIMPAQPAAPAPSLPNTSWKALGVVKPAIGVSDTAAIIGLTEESSVAGLRFAPTEVANPALARHTATRTKGGAVSVLMFEGGITHPTQGGIPAAAGKSGVAKGYRLVGHLGFLAGSSAKTGTADVQMRVELSGAGKSMAPTIIRNLNGDHSVDQKLEKSAYFRLETSAPIVVKQTPGGPMQEFDIPISFETLDKGLASLLTYPVSRPGAAFDPRPNPVAPFVAAIPKGSDFVNQANHLTAPMTKVDFDAYEAAKKNGAQFGVTVTIMVDTSASPVSDTLGIFGLRLIPDVY